MYAIVEIAGQQFKVEKDQTLFVHRLEQKEGAKISFDDVKLIDDKGSVSIGTPNLEGASVTGKVLNHLKGDKVIVFKKKRRKGYKVRNGHRQYLSEIQITGINANGSAAKKAAPKAKTEKTEKPAAKATESKPAAEKKTPAKKATTTTKSTAAKKTTAAKTTTKKTTAASEKKEDTADKA